MKRRSLLVLIFLATAVLMSAIIQKSLNEKKIRSGMQPIFKIEENLRDMNRIVIAKDGEKVILIRGEENWSVESLWSLSADPDKIKAFLASLQDIRGELRAEDQILFGDFGIDDHEAIEVHAVNTKNSKTETFLVGTKRANGQGYFVRRPDSARVFFVRGDLPERMGFFAALENAKPQSRFWVDDRFIQDDVLKIRAVEIRRKERGAIRPVLALVGRNSSEGRVDWKFSQEENHFSLDQDSIQRFFGALASLRAGNIYGPRFKESLGEPILTVRFALESNQILNYACFQKAEIFYCQESADGAVFQMGAYASDIFNFSDADFIARNPFKIQFENIPSVSVDRLGDIEVFEKGKESWDSGKMILEELMKLKPSQLLYDVKSDAFEAFDSSLEIKWLAEDSAFSLSCYDNGQTDAAVSCVYSGADYAFKIEREWIDEAVMPHFAKAPARENPGDFGGTETVMTWGDLLPENHEDPNESLS